MWADEVGEEDLPLHWTTAGTVIKLQNNTVLSSLAKSMNDSKADEFENMFKLKTSMEMGTVNKMAESSLEEEEDDSSKYVRWETPGPPEPRLEAPDVAGHLPSSQRRLDVSLDTAGM